MPPGTTPTEAIWRDVQPVLDEELSRLPDAYRATILLCGVEGQAPPQAARLLGWPVAKLRERLTRARRLLRTRLQRRGFAWSGKLFMNALADHGRTVVPPRLLAATVRTTRLLDTGTASSSAVRLAEGMLKTMFVRELKTAAAQR